MGVQDERPGGVRVLGGEWSIGYREKWRIADAILEQMMFHAQGPMTSQEIADRIGVTKVTIEQIQKRAMAKLKKEYRAEFGVDLIRI